MEMLMGVSSIVFGVFCLLDVIQGQEQCGGESWCEQGHCCGNDSSHCCTYYYELWWFWMIWGLILMLSCCCLYQQHRMKKRQRRALRELRNGAPSRGLISLPVVTSTGEVTTGSVILPQFSGGQELRLPTYEEVREMPKDPPAYEALFDGRSQSENTVPTSITPAPSGMWTSHTVAQTSPQHCSVPIPTVRDCSTQIVGDSDDLGLLDNEAAQAEESPPAYTVSASS